MTSSSAVSQMISLASGITVSLVTWNPVPGITAGTQFVSWLYERWREASANETQSERPTRTVSDVLAIVEERSFAGERPHSDVVVPKDQPAWLAQRSPADDALVGERARELSNSRFAGTNFDNWMVAAIEVQVAKRAAQIAQAEPENGDLDNWLRAERELLIANEAQRIARSGGGSGELDNWLEAERRVMTRARAAEIAASPQSGSNFDNWIRAERDIRITQRARGIAYSRTTGPDPLNDWLEAELEVLREDRIRSRARVLADEDPGRGDWDYWWQAERDVDEGAEDGRDSVLSERELIKNRAEAIASASTKGSDVDHWLQAEAELRASGDLRSWSEIEVGASANSLVAKPIVTNEPQSLLRVHPGAPVKLIRTGELGDKQMLVALDTMDRFHIIDLRSGAVVTVHHPGSVNDAALGIFDGRLALATGGEDGTIRIWDAESGQELRSIRDSVGWVHRGVTQRRINCVAWGNLEGIPVVVAGGNQMVAVWDVLGVERVGQHWHLTNVKAVAWTEIAQKPVVTSAAFDGRIDLWCPAGSTSLAFPHVVGQGAQHAAGGADVLMWANYVDRSILASAGSDSLRIWEFPDGARQGILRAQMLSRGAGSRGARDVAWAAVNGKLVLVAATKHGGLCSWDDQSSRLTQHPVTSVNSLAAFGGHEVATGHDDGIRAFDLAQLVEQ